MVAMTSASNRLPIKTPRLGAKRLEKDETLFCLLCIEILLRVSFASSDSFLLLATKRNSRTKKFTKMERKRNIFFFTDERRERWRMKENEMKLPLGIAKHTIFFWKWTNIYICMSVCIYVYRYQIRSTGLFLHDVDAVSRPSACIAIDCCVFCCDPSLTFSLIHLFIILLFLFCFFRHPRIE